MSKRLGRGLDALISGWNNDAGEENKTEEIMKIKIKNIEANPNQPRNVFNKERLEELARSIKDKGVLQPIIVSSLGNNKYRIIAGERRYRASKMAGIPEIPAIVRDYERNASYEIALLENIQRENLNPIEEAKSYEFLMTAYELTQEELSKKVNKSRSTIANTLRLLSLPDDIKKEISSGKISSGHARAILSIDDESMQKEILEETLKEKHSVRDLEEIVKTKKSGSKKEKEELDPEVRELEDELVEKFLTKVKIDALGKGKDVKGTIKISFSSLEDLERIVEQFK